MLSTIANSRANDAIASGTAVPDALVHGFTTAFWVGAVIAALGVLAGLTLIRSDELEPGRAEAFDGEPALEAVA
jgi:hypothetical protein